MFLYDLGGSLFTLQQHSFQPLDFCRKILFAVARALGSCTIQVRTRQDYLTLLQQALGQNDLAMCRMECCSCVIPAPHAPMLQIQPRRTIAEPVDRPAFAPFGESEPLWHAMCSRRLNRL